MNLDLLRLSPTLEPLYHTSSHLDVHPICTMVCNVVIDEYICFIGLRTFAMLSIPLHVNEALQEGLGVASSAIRCIFTLDPFVPFSSKRAELWRGFENIGKTFPLFCLLSQFMVWITVVSAAQLRPSFCRLLL